MKIFKRFLSVIFAVFLSFAAVGCQEETVHEETDTVGLHQKTATETNEYLLQDGRTDYTVVIPENAGETVLFAKDELLYFFKEATGVTLPVKTDAGLTFSESDKYISIGKTTLEEQAGVDAREEELGTQGLRISTKGKTVFLTSASDREAMYESYGTLYAVYEFLADTLDYDYFYTDCYSLNRNVKDIKLKNYDFKDVPDIKLRSGSYGFITSDTNVLMRYRMSNHAALFIPMKGASGHNEMQWLPQETYAETHKDFYNNQMVSGKYTRLCYTAHGKPDEYDAMLQACLESAKESLMDEKYLHLDTMSFCMEDTSDVCNCDACKDSFEKYGAHSAAMIVFLKDLKKTIDEWFATPEGQPYAREGGVKFYFYAYQTLETPPASFNSETGKWEAHPDVVCGDDIMIALALAIDNCVSLSDPANLSGMNMVNGWNVITNRKLFYMYSTNYKHYFVPYNTFNSIQGTFKVVSEKGGEILYNLGQSVQQNYATGWSILKVYLESKLAWNVNADMEYYINRFFTHYFGAGAGAMRKIFNEYRAHTVYMDSVDLNESHKMLGSKITDSRFWSKNLLEGWNDLTDEALKAIEYLQEEDKILYKSLYNHIVGERVSFNYILVEAFGDTYSAKDLTEIKQECKADILAVRLTKWRESDAPDGTGYSLVNALFTRWGV
ncbi:MAG: DUF4838 domain-containing protein [Clostridia bacterium]|nr:DUF4838 domain-containing protein [Clostridia bacterium]